MNRGWKQKILLFLCSAVGSSSGERQLRLHSCFLDAARLLPPTDQRGLEPPQMRHRGGGETSQQSAGCKRLQIQTLCRQFSLFLGNQGPWEWADALFLEESGQRLVVQDETIFELTVWKIPSVTIISRWRRFFPKKKFAPRLSGHTDEVHSVDLRGGLLVSGAADTTVKCQWQTNLTLVHIDFII